MGWVVWRDISELPEGLIFNVNYLGGEIPNFAINFSRPAGQIICQYYDFIRLGKEGYTNIHTQAYEVAKYISDELSKLGPYEFICTGDAEPAFKRKGPLVNQHGKAVGNSGALKAGFHLEGIVMRL